MLPRIGAALAKHIKPLSSSDDRQTQSQPRSAKGFKRFQPPPGQQDQSQHDTPAQRETKDPPLKLVVPSDKALAHPQGPKVSATETFLHLFSFLRTRKVSLMRWLGSLSYDKASKTRKSASRFRKGTMLDQRAE